VGKTNKYDSKFATRLRKLMSDNKVTQQTLAEAIGGTRQAISQYADGSVLPNIEKLEKIANYFGVPCDYLVGNSDVKTTNITIKEITEKTALSEKTVAKLMNAVEIGIDKVEIFHPFIDYIVENIDSASCVLEMKKIRGIQNNCKEYLLSPCKIEDMSDEEVILEKIKIEAEYEEFNKFRTAIMNHVSNLLDKLKDETVASLNERYFLLNDRSEKIVFADSETIRTQYEIEKINKELDEKQAWLYIMQAIKNHREELINSGDDNTKKE